MELKKAIHCSCIHQTFPEPDKKPLPAIVYCVLKSNGRYSLLEVALETGRKNQIRVHLQDMGHSIAGDKKYGAVSDPLRRLALHAGILEFSHPITGKCLHFATPISAILDKLFTPV